jgi:hypothetical protein
MCNQSEYERAMLEEERKLMREVSAGRLSWKKIGAMIRLNTLLSTHGRRC